MAKRGEPSADARENSRSRYWSYAMLGVLTVVAAAVGAFIANPPAFLSSVFATPYGRDEVWSELSGSWSASGDPDEPVILRCELGSPEPSFYQGPGKYREGAIHAAIRLPGTPNCVAHLAFRVETDRLGRLTSCYTAGIGGTRPGDSTAAYSVGHYSTDSGWVIQKSVGNLQSLASESTVRIALEFDAGLAVLFVNRHRTIDYPLPQDSRELKVGLFTAGCKGVEFICPTTRG